MSDEGSGRSRQLPENVKNLTHQSNLEAGVAVDIICHAPAWSSHSDMNALLERAARAALLAAGREDSTPCDLVIVLADDNEVRELNRRFRGVDKATNVLSFPVGEDLPIDDNNSLPNMPLSLGDIILGYETVRSEAINMAIDLRHHASHLVIHGVLHLLGHDHMQDGEARIMEDMETKIMLGLGLHAPYSERGNMQDAPIDRPSGKRDELKKKVS